MAGLTLHFILLCLPYLCVLRAAEGARNTSNIIQFARIIGGSTAPGDQLHYMVQLRVSNSFSCGGSLISTTHVLTAGHCVTRAKTVLPASHYTVHGGTKDLKDSGVMRKVKTIAIPANFKHGNKLTYDIAVMTLESPMTGHNIATISLCNSPIPAGAAVHVSGWGITKAGGAFSEQLQTVVLNKMPTKKCKSFFGKGAITPAMICAFKKGHGSCSGDSGGPLTFNNQICGVVSFGKKCTTTQNPGVYASVFYLKKFILKHMHE